LINSANIRAWSIFTAENERSRGVIINLRGKTTDYRERVRIYWLNLILVLPRIPRVLIDLTKSDAGSTKYFLSQQRYDAKYRTIGHHVAAWRLCQKFLLTTRKYRLHWG
jgi:hypothetical protein